MVWLALGSIGLAQRGAVGQDGAADSAPVSEVSLSALERQSQWREGWRSGDQIWLASSRELPHDCGAIDDGQLRFFRYQGGCQWTDSNLKAFLENDQHADLTLVFAHGNHVSAFEARSRGLAVYRSLVAQADASTHVRFVAFSWPSTQTRGKLRDVRLKAMRTEAASVYLARLLNQIDPNAEVSLVGYSFGARVVTGTLHVLGGGELAGQTLSDDLVGPSKASRSKTPIRLTSARAGKTPPAHRRAVRVVLISAAVDSDWLEPRAPHGRALSQVNRALVMTNPCDPAMRWYHLIDRCTRPCALGYDGVASVGALGDEAEKIEALDVRCQIGGSHDLERYLCRPQLMAASWDVLKPQRDEDTPRTEPETETLETSDSAPQATLGSAPELVEELATR